MGPREGRLLSSWGWRGLWEILKSRILSMSVSNDWLNLGIIWVNKHLKCLEFNQMWIVLDGSFLTTTIWWLALWKASFLWFPIYSSAAMKNNLSLKDFCANKKQKTKKTNPNPRNNDSPSGSCFFSLPAFFQPFLVQTLYMCMLWD